MEEQGTIPFRDKFEGVLNIGGYKVPVKGSHYDIFAGYNYECAFNGLTASNTVVFQTELRDNNFAPTDGVVGRSHVTTFFFSNDLKGPSLVICSNAMNGLHDANPWFGSASRNFEILR